MAASKKSTSMGIAYEKIIQKIMTEQLLPGTPLREERLAEEFGLSATPVREAFRRLEYEGWVQSKPYQGCFMRKFTGRDIGRIVLWILLLRLSSPMLLRRISTT